MTRPGWKRGKKGKIGRCFVVSENVETVQEPDAKAGEETEATFEPITSQDELDRVLGSRLQRERSKFADYEDLKAKAAKFDEAEEAAKSELEKAVERADKAEKLLATQKLENTRLAVVAEFELPGELADLVTGADEEEMRVKAAKLAEHVKPTVNLHQRVATDGKFPDKQSRSTADAFSDALLGRF